MDFGNSQIVNEADYCDEKYGLETEDNIQEEIDYGIDEIRIDSKTFSIFQVCKWISDKELILDPDFQRKFVWDSKKQSLLIESLILRIPIPIFYLLQNDKGYKVVIDGVQRLTTISNYCDNKFRIKGLEIVKDCNGKYFNQLDKKYQRRIEETQIVINMLDAKCPEYIKFEVFRRINTGGVMLNTQEVRNILSNARTRKLLLCMSQMESYLEVTRRQVKDTRMKSQELCLRYIAFLKSYNPYEKQVVNYVGLQRMLDMTVSMLNTMDDSEVEEIKDTFDLNMKKCRALFGERAFSRPGAERIINRALFSSFSVVINSCELEIDELKAKRNSAAAELDKLYKIDKYYDALTNATTSRSSVELQFEMANKIMEAIV